MVATALAGHSSSISNRLLLPALSSDYHSDLPTVLLSINSWSMKLSRPVLRDVIPNDVMPNEIENHNTLHQSSSKIWTQGVYPQSLSAVSVQHSMWPMMMCCSVFRSWWFSTHKKHIKISRKKNLKTRNHPKLFALRSWFFHIFLFYEISREKNIGALLGLWTEVITFGLFWL